MPWRNYLWRSRRWWISGLAFLLAVGAVLMFAVLLPADDLDRADKLASVGSMMTGFAALLVSAVALRLAVQQDAQPVAGSQAGRPDLLDQAADTLAAVVRRQWAHEAGLRQLRRPEPLRVRWSTTGRPVSAQPAAIVGRTTTAGRPTRLKLHGDVHGILNAFRQLPARQLVVLGEPGAGKTVLAMLLTLGMLEAPRRDEPVPVLLAVSSWNPLTEHLHTWLARRLAEDYPVLANWGGGGPEAAAQLVRTGRVMPVLDGLDEMPPALHHSAVDALDDAVADGGPLVVTCRGSEYQSAVVSSGRFLSRAAVVEIEPVNVADTITFLGGTERSDDLRWQPVFDHLRRHPDGPLAQALSTPLMVHLARTAYSCPGAVPAELCDPGRFSDRAVIEEHLLDAYLPSVYATPRPPQASPAHLLRTVSYRYRPAEAQRWLTFLAVHLHRQDTRDLAWWKIDRLVPRLVYGLVIGVGSAIGVSLVFSAMAGPVTGLIAGPSAGFVGGLVVGLRARATEMTQTTVRAPGRLKKLLGYVAGGFLFGTGSGLVLDLRAGPAATLVLEVAAGLLAYLTLRLIGGLREWSVTAPAHEVASRSPGSLLRSIRTGASVQTIVAGFGAAAGTGLGVALVVRPAAGLVIGLTTGVLGAPAIALYTIWGRFVFARAWLSLRGRLPLRLMRFLDDAHRRGMLRQSGAVYQFRHARLQDRLAATGTRRHPGTEYLAAPAAGRT
ncbi:MAG TPA: hypothetical protein VFM55_00060 [Micromonosporaceae bacterium]|nr:hypothetical protein [Micromonosporaceae bacterium]